jgi:hypothetical protein
MALGHWRLALDASRHVWRAAPPRPWRSISPIPLLKPPRRF